MTTNATINAAGSLPDPIIQTLRRMVRRARLHLFAYYCWPLGAAVLLAALSGRL